MSNTGEQGKVPPPPLDEDGNPIVVKDVTKSGTSATPTVEELMKKLEKLNVELKKLKTKDKKAKNMEYSRTAPSHNWLLLDMEHFQHIIFALKWWQGRDIAAASEKLAECQETMMVLGHQLQAMRPPAESSGSSPNRHQMEDLLQGAVG
jgi:hypothetical protein